MSSSPRYEPRLHFDDVDRDFSRILDAMANPDRDVRRLVFLEQETSSPRVMRAVPETTIQCFRAVVMHLQ